MPILHNYGYILMIGESKEHASFSSVFGDCLFQIESDSLSNIKENVLDVLFKLQKESFKPKNLVSVQVTLQKLRTVIVFKMKEFDLGRNSEYRNGRIEIVNDLIIYLKNICVDLGIEDLFYIPDFHFGFDKAMRVSCLEQSYNYSQFIGLVDSKFKVLSETLCLVCLSMNVSNWISRFFDVWIDNRISRLVTSCINTDTRKIDSSIEEIRILEQRLKTEKEESEKLLQRIIP